MTSLHANSAGEALVMLCTLPLLAGENIPGLRGFGPVQRTVPASTPASTARQLSEDAASRTSSWWGACGRGGRAVGAVEH